MRSQIETLFQTNDIANLKTCNYYDLLGVNRNTANFSTKITKQYRQLALRFHPDHVQLHPDHKDNLNTTEIFKLINEAYSTLNDSEKRKQYDSTLPPGSPVQSLSHFFKNTQNEPEEFNPETYSFFHAEINDWQASGCDVDITVVNKESNVRFILSGHMLPVTCLIFSNNERYLASADMNNVIKIWDLTTRSCLQTFTANTDSITHLFFTENSEWLVSGQEYEIKPTRKIEVWDFKKGRHLGLFNGFYDLRELPNPDPTYYNCIGYSCDGEGVTHLAINADGKIVAGTHHTYSYDDQDGNFIPAKPEKDATTGSANEIIVSIWPDNAAKPISILGYKLNANKTHILVHEKFSLTLWDLQTQSLLVNVKTASTKVPGDVFNNDFPFHLAFNPVNGTFAFEYHISAGNPFDIYIMNDQGEILQNFKKNPGTTIMALMYSPNGKYLIAAETLCVSVHQCETGNSFHLPVMLPRYINITPDSQKLLVIDECFGDRTIEIYDIASQKSLFREKLQFSCVQEDNDSDEEYDVDVHIFSKDSNMLALGLSDYTVRLIDLTTYKTTLLHNNRNPVFSPDNQWVVTLSRDNTICIRDYRENALVHQFKADHVANIIFINDHCFLFNEGQKIKTWDIATSKMNDVCVLSSWKNWRYGKESLHYTNQILFFKDKNGLLTKADISTQLNQLENQMVPLNSNSYSSCGF